MSKFLLLLIFGIVSSTILIYFVLEYLEESKLEKQKFDPRELLYSEFQGEKYFRNYCDSNPSCIGAFENQTRVHLTCDIEEECIEKPPSPELLYSEFEGEKHLDSKGCLVYPQCYGIYENQTKVPLACDVNYSCPKILMP